MARRNLTLVSRGRPIQRKDLTRLIASGEATFPVDADPSDQRELAEQVRSMRAERLVRHLARLIALAVYRAESGEKRVPSLRPPEQVHLRRVRPDEFGPPEPAESRPAIR
jgi:hypothetical protein